MSYSKVLDDFAKIMAEKQLTKTAAKKDKDTHYNIVPDKAGPDDKVEKTGYELVEIAHPEQIQVAESQLNDGIVENGVERQKAMVDVALRNPRGVLADLMKTLTKVANILDENMTDESLKLAEEVDELLEKMAQQHQLNPIEMPIGEAGRAQPFFMDTVEDLGIGAAAPGLYRKTKNVVKNISNKVKNLTQEPVNTTAPAKALNKVQPASEVANDTVSEVANPAAEITEAAETAAGEAANVAAPLTMADITGAILDPYFWIPAALIGTGFLVVHLASAGSDASGIYQSFEYAAENIDNLDFEDGSPNEMFKEKIVAELKQLASLKNNADVSSDNGIADLIKQTDSAVKYVYKMTPNVKLLIQLSEDGSHWYSVKSWSHDKQDALDAWNKTLSFCKEFELKYEAKLKQLSEMVKAKQNPSLNKTVSQPAAATHFVTGPEVESLQQLLGNVEVDSKFGKDTWHSLMNVISSSPYLLDQVFSTMSPNLKDAWQNWTEQDIEKITEALQELKSSQGRIG